MGVARKRPLWTALAIALALSLAVMGCSGDNGGGGGGASPGSGAGAGNGGDGSTGAQEPFAISIFNEAPGQVPGADNKIYKRIREELGVTLEEEYLVGDLEQKLGVMIAGGDYPDMITAEPKLVSAGAVIPLEDLIEEHAPNLKAHYAKAWNQMKDPTDGHIYWLPNYGVYNGELFETIYNGPAFWIQKAVLKEFGYPRPKSLEEYFDLIRQYQEKYPTIDGQPTIGFTALAFDWRTFGLLNPPEHLAGYPNDGGVIVDDGVAQIFADKDIAKRYYGKLNELYNENLVDKEAFVQNYDQYLAKIASGRVLGMFDQRWNFQSSEDSLVAQDRRERTYVGFPLVYDESIKDYYRDRPPVNLNNGYGITVDAEDPVRIIKFLDTLMSEEWQKLFSWGVEGEDYLVDEEGKFYRTPEMRTQQEDPAWKLANKADGLFGQLPKLEGSYSDGNATGPGNQPSEFYDGLKPVDKEVLEAYGHQTWTDFFSPPPENPIYYPAWQIDLVEGSEASVANKRLNDVQLQYLPKAIMAPSGQFEAVWSEYVGEIGKINIKAIEDRINEQLQWRIDNWTVE